MDFSLILFLFVVITGLVSLLYWLLVERPNIAATPESPVAATTTTPRAKPLLVEYARALFPVVLLVFGLRSFVIEPFRIPSGSMLPSLRIGDFILVNKFLYGLRLPVINQKIVAVSQPARGDVMVFRYPRDPTLTFVKRVIGLPGDVITYRDKKLSINGTPAPRSVDGEFLFRGQPTERYLETTDDSTHSIILEPTSSGIEIEEVRVPPGNYFVMGDNRDNSNDSRYWRFVPEENVVGKAFLIWFSWQGLANGGVRWNRLGEGIE